jgi:hypothetical protein
MEEGYEVYDSIVTYPPSIQFIQNINHKLRRFFIEVNIDGNCYYCDGKEKEHPYIVALHIQKHLVH